MWPLDQFNVFTPKAVTLKIQQTSQILICIMLKYKANSTTWNYCQRGFINLNGHTIEFRPKNKKLELHTKKIVPCESTAEEVSFEWWFGPKNQKLELHTKKIVPCESTAEEVSFEW